MCDYLGLGDQEIKVQFMSDRMLKVFRIPKSIWSFVHIGRRKRLGSDVNEDASGNGCTHHPKGKEISKGTLLFTSRLYIGD